MRKKRFIELDLNKLSPEELDRLEIYAVKKIEVTGQKLIDTINTNPGLIWMVPESIKISTIKECAEIIEERKQYGNVEFKLAKAILKLIKEPRNAAEKRRKTRKAGK